MRKKFTLFLAVCMLAATSVSAATVKDTADTKTEAQKEVKDEKKADDKEEAKDEKKADDKEEVKDEKKADDKEEAKDEKKADDKEEAKDEKKADDKKEAKDEKKADDKKEAKDEKKADDKKEELEAKLKDLKQADAVKVANDAYKALEKIFAEHESSSEIPDYFALKADYATKEKVQAFLEKSFSAKYVESFLKLDGKFKTIDEKCYVKTGNMLNKCDFSKATLKSKEVKDDTAVLFFETVDNNGEKTTYKATFVYESDAWKVDALTYTTQRGLTGNVLI